jgi:hypothetical protein
MGNRKTFKVNDLTIQVNRMLANSAEDARDGRVALSVLLEKMLMDTGNYHGFRYTDGDQGRRDDSRRSYYLSPS